MCVTKFRDHSFNMYEKFSNANTESIQKAISTFDWFKAFLHRNANEKYKILTDILLNVFKYFISIKLQKIDYKTSDWMKRSITLSLKKIKTYQGILS